MQNNKNKEWFTTWFDSPYYHILYRDRNFNEAERFIDALFQHLHPNKSAKVIDIACGKGRHAIQMNNLGFSVDAFDLSENSISAAKLSENKTLHFYVNDIRKPFKKNEYQFAFNLFTSFGYFEDEQDNYQAIKAIANSLTANGTFVMDFMNVNKVIKNLLAKEVKVIDGIEFNITKEINNNFIVKHIKFTDKGNDYHFSEKVKAITLNDFKAYFKSAKLNLITTFGDYQLNDFDINTSDRLIMVAKK